MSLDHLQRDDKESSSTTSPQSKKRGVVARFLNHVELCPSVVRGGRKTQEGHMQNKRNLNLTKRIKENDKKAY